MKHLIQFTLLFLTLFGITFAINYLIFAVDPANDMNGVLPVILYGCAFFSLIISGMKLIYLPPKTKLTK